MKIGKFTVNRNGIHWVSFRDLANGGIAIDAHRFPRPPVQLGNSIGCDAETLALWPGGEGSLVFIGVERCLHNAQATHLGLRAKGKRGVNFATLEFYYVPLGVSTDSPARCLIGWKAEAA